MDSDDKVALGCIITAGTVIILIVIGLSVLNAVAPGSIDWITGN